MQLILRFACFKIVLYLRFIRLIFISKLHCFYAGPPAVFFDVLTTVIWPMLETVVGYIV
jgi:hypothetical protein